MAPTRIASKKPRLCLDRSIERLREGPADPALFVKKANTVRTLQKSAEPPIRNIIGVIFVSNILRDYSGVI
jgi:hypothetical protein